MFHGVELGHLTSKVLVHWAVFNIPIRRKHVTTSLQSKDRLAFHLDNCLYGTPQLLQNDFTSQFCLVRKLYLCSNGSMD